MQINARNVNDAYNGGLGWLKAAGQIEETRNGRALVSPEPVTTCYSNSWERLLLDEKRDANPFFHLAEAIWMLAGCDKVPWLAQYNSNIARYSDDGKRFHGAYGYRWRTHFGPDQLLMAMKMVKERPVGRQVVMTMWDPRNDLMAATNDVPCNTHIYFRERGGVLDMTVCCRSNDMVWGTYGANAVHFSFLQELLAYHAGLGTGKYYHFSNNFHIYEQHWDLMQWIPAEAEQPYRHSWKCRAMPLLAEGETVGQFLGDCCNMVWANEPPTLCRFMSGVVWPLLRYYPQRKTEPFPDVPSCDWGLACWQWIKRRM